MSFSRPDNIPAHKIPNTANWQLCDFVQFLDPIAVRIKKNHDRWKRIPDSNPQKNKLQQQNHLLLLFFQQVLDLIPQQTQEAVVISDLHFGIKYASDLEVLVYLHSIMPQYLFLNGDTIDQLVIQSRHDINPVQRLAIRRIGAIHKTRGSQVIRLRGNHDPMPNRKEGKGGYAGIPVYRDVMFIGEDGSRSLITHGDRFDRIVGSKGRLEKIGSIAYDLLVVGNHYHKKVSRLLRMPHVSIARLCKVTTKRICMAMSHFDDAVFAVSAKHEARYILCGHTHIYMHIARDGREYINSADWVETGAALVKTAEGWQLIHPMQRREAAGYIHPKNQRKDKIPEPKKIKLPPNALHAMDPIVIQYACAQQMQMAM